MTNPPDREVAVFGTALRLPSGERAAFLDQACADDAAFRKRVEELLQASEEAGDFLGSPAATPSGGTPSLPTNKPGDRIGRYKLLQQIGEGGCGIVYMAEQEEPVRRRVALKVIKLGMDTKEVIARFEAERQALALMDHPNIAKVLDAGATDTGRPYFVMELVRGIKITEFCDENKISTEERLKLFIQICQAIQHAHQKGIIHRDIKPSNILVTVNDGVPVPKVIDFGIAKATQGRLTDKTLFTAFEQFLGTPAYMSPEQAVMTSLDIDTRSDIYSLGVLLYELLTGKTPFDANELLQAGLDEMRRTIREKEPQKPSTRLSTMLDAERTATATQRQTEPPKLIHILRGDLDWIAMKCLEKDRARRYETANGLAADIERHLSNEPVIACPPSGVYLVRKAISRHKGTFAATAAIIVVLIIGVVLSISEAFRARRAEQEQTRLRQQAETEAVKSQQVAQFLEDMLEGVGPGVALGRDTTLLQEILDKTADRVGKDLKDQPEVEAELRSVIGDTYRALGRGAQAEAMHRDALAIYKKLYGNENPYVASLLNTLAEEASDRDNQAEAETLEREALAMRKKLLGGENLAVAESLDFLAIVLLRQSQTAPALLKQSKLAEAETLERDALAMRKRLLGSTDLLVAQSIDGLGVILEGQGKLSEAETLRREALAMERQVLGNDENLTVAIQLISVADTLNEQGKYPEAETLFRQGLALERKLFNNDNPQLAYALWHLANLLQREGKLAEAESLYREALAMWRKYLPDSHPYIGGTMRDLAGVLRDEGRLAEAEKTDREALAVQRKLWPQGNPEVAATLFDLELVLAEEHRWPEAETAGREALAMSMKMSAVGSPEVPTAMNNLADAFYALGRDQEAIALQQQSSKLNPTDTFNTLKLAAWQAWFGQDADYEATCRRLVQEAERTEQTDAAERAAKAACLRPSTDAALLAQALSLARQGVELGGNKPGLPWNQLSLGLAEYRNGQYAAAEHSLTIAEQTARDDSAITVDYQQPLQGTARLFRAMSLFQQDQPEEARKLFSQAEAQMPPLPKDESKPFVDGKPISKDVLIWWLAYKEARVLIENQTNAPTVDIKAKAN